MPTDVLVPDPREDNLPIWVRDRLARLRDNVRTAERAREAAELLAENVRRSTSPDASSIVLDDPTNRSTEDNLVGIAGSTTVIFRLDEPTPDYQGREIMVQRFDDGTVDISTPDPRLTIVPVDQFTIRVSSGK